MTAVSTAPVLAARLEPLATRNLRLASVASRVEQKVEGVRRALRNRAPKGFAAELASVMAWRVERRGREISGVEKLSLADVAAEIEVHIAHGRQDAVDEIVAALLEGLTATAVPFSAGSVMRVFDRNGQLFLGFDR